MSQTSKMGLLFLILVLASSALLMIYFKFQSRQLFIELQKKEHELDSYEEEWGQLQLELTTLTEQNRIEYFAANQLKLVMPLRESIIYLKP